jgi:hypothetical protein
MTDQAHPTRRSGAPSWAILLGLGTAEESAARAPAIKWAVRAFWTVVLTVIFAIYVAVSEDRSPLSRSAVVPALLLAILTMLSWGLGTSLYLRQRNRQLD